MADDADDRNERDFEPPANAQWLAHKGVEATPQELKRFEEIIAGELEMRVGNELYLLMTSEQLEEFEKLHEANDEKGKTKFLETAMPKYGDVVHDERARLAQEIIQASDKKAFIESLGG